MYVGGGMNVHMPSLLCMSVAMTAGNEKNQIIPSKRQTNIAINLLY
jgi:hypothetical protein